MNLILHVGGGFLYLALVMDKGSRDIVGWHLGDRATGCEVAKEQLLRPLDEDCLSSEVSECLSDRQLKNSKTQELKQFEKQLLKEANSLGIGPMGLGGKTTLLGVKIASRPRVPASFFVTVAYMCWACRRQTATFR